MTATWTPVVVSPPMKASEMETTPIPIGDDGLPRTSTKFGQYRTEHLENGNWLYESRYSPTLFKIGVEADELTATRQAKAWLKTLEQVDLP